MSEILPVEQVSVEGESGVTSSPEGSATGEPPAGTTLSPWLEDVRLRWLALAALCLTAALARIEPLNDEDLWWHLRAGQEIFRQRTWHLVETISYLREGDIWNNTQWLFDVMLHLSSKLGTAGPILLSASAAMATTALVGLWAFRIAPSRPWIALLTTCLVSAATTGVFVPRPHAIGMVFLSAALLGIERTQACVSLERTAIRKALPVLGALAALQLVWSHTHDSHVLLSVLLWARVGAAWLQGDATLGKTRVVPAALTTILALTAGPLGPGLVLQLAKHVGTFATLHIQEWKPMTFEGLFPNHPNDGLFRLLVWGGALGAILARRAIVWDDLLLYLTGLALSLLAQRFEATWALLSVPLIARTSVPEWVPHGHRIERSAALVAIATALPLVWYTIAPPWPRPAFGTWEPRFPVHAMDALVKLGATGRVFHHYNDGGYIGYRAPRKLQVAIDGRTPAFFNDTDFQEWTFAAQHPAAYERFVRQRAVSHVLAPRASYMCTFARQDPSMRLVYVDSYRALFTRKESTLLPGVALTALSACPGEPDEGGKCSEQPELTAAILNEAAHVESLAPAAPWPWIVRMQVAAMCKDGGGPTVAVNAAKEAIARGADDPNNMLIASFTLMQSGDKLAALEAANAGLKYPQSEHLLVLKAVIMRDMGDTGGALTLFRKAEKALDQQMAPHERFEYARTLLAAGDPDAALVQAAQSALFGFQEALAMTERLMPMVEPDLAERVRRQLAP